MHLPSLSAHPVPCRAAGDPAITAIGRRQGVPAGGDKVLPRHWRSIVGAGRGAYENRHHRCQHGVQSHWTNHFGCYFLMRLAPSYLMSSLQFGRRLYIGPFQRLETWENRGAHGWQSRRDERDNLFFLIRPEIRDNLSTPTRWIKRSEAR
jgi:hypothetical protein